ncbi:hypothetical protein EG832_12525 [bacterium]|nr:hypothetical protein [bacterium]
MLVILVAQGIEESTLQASYVTDLKGITASNFCHPGSDCEHHLFLEMSSSNSRSVNQAEKVEPVIVARTESSQSRIKPVNVLLILQNAVNLWEQFSLRILFHLANPQTFHTRTLINFLRI